MFKLLKIDLLDTYIFADIFEDEACKLIGETENLSNLLDLAIAEFKSQNKNFTTYDDWAKKAEDGGWEYELFHGARTIFRASMLLVDPMVEPALRLAQKYHGKDIRKGDGLPYLIHLLDISRLIYRQFQDKEPEVLIASVCHDLLEDTDCPESEIEEACGAEVLRIVKAVSHDTSMDGDDQWRERKSKYIKGVEAGGERAMIVCVCDKISNLKSLLAQYEKEGASIWKKFNKGKEDKLWFESGVLAMLKNNLSHPLVEQYEALLGRYESLEV
jgi:hypothetical protein